MCRHGARDDGLGLHDPFKKCGRCCDHKSESGEYGRRSSPDGWRVKTTEEQEEDVRLGVLSSDDRDASICAGDRSWDMPAIQANPCIRITDLTSEHPWCCMFFVNVLTSIHLYLRFISTFNPHIRPFPRKRLLWRAALFLQTLTPRFPGARAR